MNNVNNAYKDKYFSILGDSISTFEGFSQPREAAFYDLTKKLQSNIITVADTWWGAVIEQLGATPLVNNSWSGSTVSKSPLYQVESYGCSNQRTAALGKNGISPNVIMVFMGINDWGVGFKVDYDFNENDVLKGCGSECGIIDERGCENFSVAYQTMLKKLKNNYPQAEIWCLTLPFGSCFNGKRVDFSCDDKRKINIEKYCNAIMLCAQKCGCRVIDLYQQECVYNSLDGFHPDSCGMQTIANCVLACLK